MNNIVLNKLVYLLLIVGGLFLIFSNAFKILGVILPFLIAWWLSSIIVKSASLIMKKFNIQASISYTIVLILLFGMIILGIFGISAIIYFSALSIANALPSWTDAISRNSQIWAEHIEGLFASLPTHSPDLINKVLAGVANSASSVIALIGTFLLDVLKRVPNLFFSIIVTAIATFFFTIERDKITTAFTPYKTAYIDDNVHWQKFRANGLHVIFGYLKAQLILMTVTFIISAIGLTVIGVEQSILKGLAIGVVDALPLLGPAAVYVPWAISMLITGKYFVAIKLLVLYAVTTLTRQMLEPKILGEQIGIHPLLTLSSLYIGVKLLGASGLIIGPMITISIIAFLRQKKGAKV